MAGRSRVRAAVLISLGIVVPGVADYALSSVGYNTLASVVWAVGYGILVLTVWYYWIRPLDISGPSG